MPTRMTGALPRFARSSTGAGEAYTDSSGEGQGQQPAGSTNGRPISLVSDSSAVGRDHGRSARYVAGKPVVGKGRGPAKCASRVNDGPEAGRQALFQRGLSAFAHVHLVEGLNQQAGVVAAAGRQVLD